MVGIVVVANMFGAGLEVVLKNDLYSNPLVAFVVYPDLFLSGSILRCRRLQPGMSGAR